jgi:hypothetical protein
LGGTEHSSGASLYKKVIVIYDRLVFIASIDLTCEDVASIVRVLRHRLMAEKTWTFPRPNPVMGS